jgi:hypothetical protein
MTRPTSYLLVACVFGAHNIEEGLGAARMLELLRSTGPQWLQAFYATIGSGQLRFGLAFLTLLGLLLALAATTKTSSRGWTLSMLVFCAVISLNALAHIGLAIAVGGYMPGLATAVAICLPVSGWLLLRAFRQRWLPASVGWTVAPLAIVVHGPGLYALLTGLGALYRTFTGSAA